MVASTNGQSTLRLAGLGALVLWRKKSCSHPAATFMTQKFPNMHPLIRISQLIFFWITDVPICSTAQGPFWMRFCFGTRKSWLKSILNVCEISGCFFRCPIRNFGNSNLRLEGGLPVVALNNAKSPEIFHSRWNSHCLWMLYQPFLFSQRALLNTFSLQCMFLVCLSQIVPEYLYVFSSIFIFLGVQQVQLVPFVVLDTRNGVADRPKDKSSSRPVRPTAWRGKEKHPWCS